MNQNDLDKLRLELSVKAKNGLDFVVSAIIIWSLISFIWTLSYSDYNKSVLTFIVGGPMLPLAFLLSKVFKTSWKVEGNPLEPLGLWLNFAQLFYFPMLVFVLIMKPEYFVLCYVIITGAHFFPYAWYYNTKAFAVMAGVISIGAMAIALTVQPANLYLIPLFMVGSLLVLAVWLFLDFKQSKLKYAQQTES
ncbi:MAG: hypothetical protein KBF45_04080 [Cyclobacteriaceae bacterium]|jgi:hypothetical protein|nr:hypothetical protein [Cyclobacteriaceae bacterium]